MFSASKPPSQSTAAASKATVVQKGSTTDILSRETKMIQVAYSVVCYCLWKCVFSNLKLNLRCTSLIRNLLMTLWTRVVSHKTYDYNVLQTSCFRWDFSGTIVIWLACNFAKYYKHARSSREARKLYDVNNSCFCHSVARCLPQSLMTTYMTV